MAKKKDTKAPTEGDGKVEERMKAVMALAMDPATLAAPMARNPAMENKIKQGIQSGLFFLAIPAQYTQTLEDDKAIARAMVVTMDPAKWAVIADLIWGG